MFHEFIFTIVKYLSETVKLGSWEKQQNAFDRCDIVLQITSFETIITILVKEGVKEISTSILPIKW